MRGCCDQDGKQKRGAAQGHLQEAAVAVPQIWFWKQQSMSSSVVCAWPPGRNAFSSTGSGPRTLPSFLAGTAPSACRGSSELAPIPTLLFASQQRRLPWDPQNEAQRCEVPGLPPALEEPTWLLLELAAWFWGWTAPEEVKSTGDWIHGCLCSPEWRLL